MAIGFGYTLAKTQRINSPRPESVEMGPVEIGALKPSLGVVSIREAEILLQTRLHQLNLHQLENGVPGISKALHTGTIRYNRRDPTEHWMSLREIWKRGYGDCEDLACAVAAERTFRGYPSRMVLIRVRPTLMHAVVHDERTGRLIDPSRTGGMGQP